MVDTVTKIALPRLDVRTALTDLETIKGNDSFNRDEVRLANQALKDLGIRKAWMKTPFDAKALDALLAQLKGINKTLQGKQDREICETEVIPPRREPIQAMFDIMPKEPSKVRYDTTCRTITYSAELAITPTKKGYEFSSKIIEEK